MDFTLPFFASSFLYLIMIFLNKINASKRKLAFFYVVSIIVNLCVYYLLLGVLHLPIIIAIIINQLTIFAFFYFFMLESKGMRSVFIFISIALIALIVFLIVDILALWTNLSPSLYIGFITVIIGFVTWALYAISPTVIKLQETFDKGWLAPATIAFIGYGVVVFFADYPTPIHGRPEYYPVLFVLSFTIIGLHVFLYVLISELRQVADRRENEELLFTQKQLDALLQEKQEQYIKIAYYDHLTGLGNRAKLSDDVGNFSLNFKGCTPLVCFAIDINGLKKINDTRGHNAGDIAIKDFAAMLTKVFGEAGFVYRIGGDEFAVICRGINRGKAEIFLFELEELQKEYNRMHDVKITYAIGYSIQLSKQAEIPDSERCRACVDYVMRESDDRMYSDKQRIKARLVSQNF